MSTTTPERPFTTPESQTITEQLYRAPDITRVTELPPDARYVLDQAGQLAAAEPAQAIMMLLGRADIRGAEALEPALLALSYDVRIAPDEGAEVRKIFAGKMERKRPMQEAVVLAAADDPSLVDALFRTGDAHTLTELLPRLAGDPPYHDLVEKRLRMLCADLAAPVRPAIEPDPEAARSAELPHQLREIAAMMPLEAIEALVLTTEALHAGDTRLALAAICQTAGSYTPETASALLPAIHRLAREAESRGVPAEELAYWVARANSQVEHNPRRFEGQADRALLNPRAETELFAAANTIALAELEEKIPATSIEHKNVVHVQRLELEAALAEPIAQALDRPRAKEAKRRFKKRASRNPERIAERTQTTRIAELQDRREALLHTAPMHLHGEKAAREQELIRLERELLKLTLPGVSLSLDELSPEQRRELLDARERALASGLDAHHVSLLRRQRRKATLAQLDTNLSAYTDVLANLNLTPELTNQLRQADAARTRQLMFERGGLRATMLEALDRHRTVVLGATALAGFGVTLATGGAGAGIGVALSLTAYRAVKGYGGALSRLYSQNFFANRPLSDEELASGGAQLESIAANIREMGNEAQRVYYRAVAIGGIAIATGSFTAEVALLGRGEHLFGKLHELWSHSSGHEHGHAAGSHLTHGHTPRHPDGGSAPSQHPSHPLPHQSLPGRPELQEPRWTPQAMHLAPGEGLNQQLHQMGIPASRWHEVLRTAAPQLRHVTDAHGAPLVYDAPDGLRLNQITGNQFPPKALTILWKSALKVGVSPRDFAQAA